MLGNKPDLTKTSCGWLLRLDTEGDH